MSTKNSTSDNTAKKQTPETNLVSEDNVIEFLKSNPKFFQNQTQLLTELTIPHDVGASSLIERQVKVLRERNKDLEQQLNGLIRTARGNEQIVTRLQRLTLELMRADNLDEVIATCQDLLRGDFNADFVSFRVFSNNDDYQPELHLVDINDDNLKSFDKVFDKKTPVCGQLEEEQCGFLFPENSKSIESVALMPLFTTKRLGILALGSKDESRFHAGMGTIFISHLAELISTSLSRHID